MDNALKERLSAKDKWLRVVFMVLFGVAGYIVQFLIWLIAVVQIVISFVMGSPNQNLVHLGQGLSAFFYHIMQYLTFNVEEKPYPFTPWPGSSKNAE